MPFHQRPLWKKTYLDEMPTPPIVTSPVSIYGWRRVPKSRDPAIYDTGHYFKLNYFLAGTRNLIHSWIFDLFLC